VELHAKLAEHRCKYTDLVSLYYAFCFETDCWAGVVGDGDNGAYEWFLSTPNGVQVSDSGYGDSLLALRDVLNKVVI
jgi:hypothetical protein